MGVSKFDYLGVTKFDLTSDTVDAAHLYQGYTAHGADGNLITGTMAPQIVSLFSGEVTDSYDQTTAAAAKTCACGSVAYTSSGILYIKVRDKAGKRNGYFYGTDVFLFNRNPAEGSTSTKSLSSNSQGGVSVTYRYADNAMSTYSAYNGYGLYGYSVSSAGNVVVRHRYNASYSLTIDGTYLIDIYLITGPFANWYGTVS